MKFENIIRSGMQNNRLNVADGHRHKVSNFGPVAALPKIL